MTRKEALEATEKALALTFGSVPQSEILCRCAARDVVDLLLPNGDVGSSDDGIALIDLANNDAAHRVGVALIDHHRDRETA